MELTKVCVELVWRLCFGVEFVWILNFGFIPTFGVILGVIVGWFYAVFLACLVPCLWHVLSPQLGGYCGRWTRAVLGWFRVKNWRVPELPRSSLARRCLEATLLHGWAQICNLGYAIAWVSTQLRGFPRNCLAPASSGTLLCGFPRNCIALAHFQTSNFGQP